MVWVIIFIVLDVFMCLSASILAFSQASQVPSLPTLHLLCLQDVLG